MTATALKNDSLAYSLLGAARAVALVRTGTALPQALARTSSALQASPQTRGAMQDIAYRTMRLRGRADALVQAMTSKPPQPALLLALLECHHHGLARVRTLRWFLGRHALPRGWIKGGLENHPTHRCGACQQREQKVLGLDVAAHDDPSAAGEE